MATSILTPEQRYAAGALLALSLRQAQIHQTRPPGPSSFPEGGGDQDPADETLGGSSSATEGDRDGDSSRRLWTHESHGLLRPVFRFLEIDPKAWHGLEETAASSPPKHHVGAFLRMISEEDGESSSERSDQELGLTKAVDSLALNLKTISSAVEATKEKRHECHDISTSDMVQRDFEMTFKHSEIPKLTKSNNFCDDILVNYQRKVTVLFELLSACVADTARYGKESADLSKGYDARHRTALRLLATWLDVKWIKMEAMEIMVACSVITATREKVAQLDETEAENKTWSRWKHGGIIGAAALTGGTLMAITGGLAAPAIAAGFSALAPTLGTLVPVVGASGFAAAASAAGSVAGSVAVAASFGAAGAGLSVSKMARRIGSVEEFEFRPMGENHNQGRLAVGILISGFVFEEEDFVRPWEGTEDNLERYALQWESMNLIALSTAIQDWLTSRLTMELMKQGAMMTVLGTLVSALAWPTALLAATDFIDSKWSIAIDRSDKAGKLLAEVLLKELQGNRPVTLMGFSLGARVIFRCLQQLAESGENEGLVERVVLLGAPISLKGEDWESARKMVAGRFVNAFSTDDWILGVTFRASLLSQGLAGIQAVNIPGIENVDVTHLIDGHSSYLWTVHEILQQIELDSCYPIFLCAPIRSE